MKGSLARFVFGDGVGFADSRKPLSEGARLLPQRLSSAEISTTAVRTFPSRQAIISRS